MLKTSAQPQPESVEVFALDVSQRGAERWEILTPRGTPPAMRSLASTLIDSANSRLFFFGGITLDDNQTFNDFWELDFSSPGNVTWQRMTDIEADLPALAGAVWLTSEDDSQALLVGGITSFGDSGELLFNQQAWIFDYHLGQESLQTLDIPFPAQGVGGQMHGRDPVTGDAFIFGADFLADGLTTSALKLWRFNFESLLFIEVPLVDPPVLAFPAFNSFTTHSGELMIASLKGSIFDNHDRDEAHF